MVNVLLRNLAIGSLFISSLELIAKEKLVFGYLPFKPLIFSENSRPKGELFEFVANIMKHSQISHEFVEFPPRRLIAQLQAGLVDIAVGSSEIGNLNNFVYVGKNRIMTVTISIYQKANPAFLVGGMDQITGKSIGLIGQYDYAGLKNILTETSKNNSINLVANYADGFHLLDLGRIDMMMVYDSEINQNKLDTKSFLITMLRQLDIRLLVSKKTKDAKKILEKLDGLVAEHAIKIK